jgi:hypothetical protein
MTMKSWFITGLAASLLLTTADLSRAQEAPARRIAQKVAQKETTTAVRSLRPDQSVPATSSTAKEASKRRLAQNTAAPRPKNDKPAAAKAGSATSGRPLTVLPAPKAHSADASARRYDDARLSQSRSEHAVARPSAWQVQKARYHAAQRAARLEAYRWLGITPGRTTVQLGFSYSTLHPHDSLPWGCYGPWWHGAW